MLYESVQKTHPAAGSYSSRNARTNVERVYSCSTDVYGSIVK